MSISILALVPCRLRHCFARIVQPIDAVVVVAAADARHAVTIQILAVSYQTDAAAGGHAVIPTRVSIRIPVVASLYYRVVLAVAGQMSSASTNQIFHVR